MPTLFQINVTANWGSTGRIAEEIGRLALGQGWDCYMAYGRGMYDSRLWLVRVGSRADMYWHGVQSRLLDRHGLASVGATRRLVRQMDAVKPDVVHLHNIHGYYLNYELLFRYLAAADVPVVWTLHDCWPFTGHCAYFSYVGCDRWKRQCHDCPQKQTYPAAWLCDRSKKNFDAKKKAFTSVRRLTLVPVSDWLGGLLGESFLQAYPVKRIYNGVDTDVFCPQPSADALKGRLGIRGKRMVLGVASVWSTRKGLADFIALRQALPLDEYAVVLVGLSGTQLKDLPTGMVGIPRTNSVQELAEYYSAADVFVNPTWEDNFPTTNIEALACGTPVVTYRTGGSVEAVDCATGMVVVQGDIPALASAVMDISGKGKAAYAGPCRQRALDNFDKNERFQEYIKLYQSLLL